MSQRVLNSDMLYTSKPRPATQAGWQRRRFTKSAASVDGEYDPDLALAIQESLKQAEIDALKAKERQDDTLSKMELKLFNENNRKEYSKMSSTIELSTETKQLKDLVCVHMDLIQQQQDVINQKEKTIKSLKTENNALQCRLQRMERRMALLKQKEDMSGSPHTVASPPPKPGTMSYTEPISVPMERGSHKRKFESSPLPRRTLDLPRPTLPKTPVLAIDISKTKNRDSHRKRKISSVQTSEGENNTLETSNLYYVSYYEPLVEDVEVDSRESLLSRAKTQGQIEVPSFRIKTYTNLYVIEGTEDHEDETFIRRHQKPEIEEKRRKRWDNQRMRDEKMYEKLRDRQGSNSKYRKPEDPVESFYPVLDDITHIEVADKIPVTAFGQPIPFVKEQAFSLPWTPKQSSSSRHRHK